MISLACVTTMVALLTKLVWGPALVLVGASIGAGCIDDVDAELDLDGEASSAGAATCGAADAYTPYRTASDAIGSVESLPWRGATTSYPDGRETFDRYAPLASIECANEKAKLAHLDVTAGCFTAVTTGTDAVYHRARVDLTDAGAFRAVAIGYAGSDVVKWTDQRSEYRFYYSAQAAGVNPGFKIFARYRSEDDLYVASWRFDGVVQIQRKQCGAYTTLAKLDGLAPTPRAWHRLRFDAIGDKLSLYLDDRLVLTAQSSTLSWGTVGIRIDGASGAYVDDWRVF